MSPGRGSERDGSAQRSPAEAHAAVSRGDPIRRSATVPTGVERAFDLFTKGMGTWWPLDLYSRAVSDFAHENVDAVKLEFDARWGGSIVEEMSNGRVLHWAEVTEWDAPWRVVLAWRPHAQPEPPTELEVTFAARAGGTLVEVEHRGWDRLSDAFRESLYDVYVRGWNLTLGRFTTAAGS